MNLRYFDDLHFISPQAREMSLEGQHRNGTILAVNSVGQMAQGSLWCLGAFVVNDRRGHMHKNEENPRNTQEPPQSSPHGKAFVRLADGVCLPLSFSRLNIHPQGGGTLFGGHYVAKCTFGKKLFDPEIRPVLTIIKIQWVQFCIRKHTKCDFPSIIHHWNVGEIMQNLHKNMF